MLTLINVSLDLNVFGLYETALILFQQVAHVDVLKNYYLQIIILIFFFW